MNMDTPPIDVMIRDSTRIDECSLEGELPEKKILRFKLYYIKPGDMGDVTETRNIVVFIGSFNID